MKTRLYKKIAMFMAFVLIVPMFWSMNEAVVQAATPSFVQTKVEIVGTGETYQLEIQNKVDKSTYNWSSTNTEIATVTDKGLVSSVSRGSASIRCKITYPSKKTKTLTCKVTVSIPATEVTISNATLVNGAQILDLYESMDFDCNLTPLNSSDKLYWTVGGGDPNCIRIDDEKNGRITAIKAGKVILVATAAKSATPDAAALSIVNDAVIIEVVGPTATVKSADITASNTITVVFDSAVNPSTVIGINNTLSDNISLSLSKDTKGVLADDPGALTASLSTDNKTLTITSKNSLDGYYGINFTSSILTIDGIALESYYKKINFADVTPPDYVNTTLDDTGFIATIGFTEAMNFNNLKISGASVVSTTGAIADAATISTLNNVLNYTISQDKKSMSINLSKIAGSDYGKVFSVIISGVTDLAGNPPANVYLTAYLRTDTSYKPQAKILSVVRTSYNVISVTYDRAIQFGGLLQVAGGSAVYGVPDATNGKIVNYTISDYEAAYTGLKTVTVGYYSSYNVSPTDLTSNTMQTYAINFTADITSPYIVSNVYNADTGVLTLTYSENVTLRSTTGIISSIYTSSTDDIKPNTNITYSRITHTEGNNIIKLQLTGAALIGNYTLAMEQGFVSDNFKNQSVGRTLTINNSSGTTSELPGPYSIIQSPTNLSQVIVKFLNKLDIATATTVSNYSIAGLTIQSATLTENTSETGATVILTLADGSIAVEVPRPVTIKGIRGYNNSYSAITNYQTNLTLKENARPGFVSATFDTITKNTIKLNFTEAIAGTITVKVLIYGTIIELPSTVLISGNSVIINLSQVPSSGSYLSVNILTNAITDVNNNPVTAMASTIPVPISY